MTIKNYNEQQLKICNEQQLKNWKLQWTTIKNYNEWQLKITMNNN